MQLPDIIKKSLGYIEDNLRTDIAAEELARLANYSLYHYYRLFSAAMGTSVAEYIKKRRLDHALAEIAAGRKAVDVVLEYGFDTYAGFYKAFTKMYGCSPRKYISIYHGHRPRKPEVANSHMYTEKDLRKILENWEVDKRLPIGEVRYLRDTKVANNAWLIGSNYILRAIGNSDERTKALKDMKLAKALYKQGFASAVPVPTRAGGDYVDGTSMFVLTRQPKGTRLEKPERFGERRFEYGEKLGVGIAHLHKVLRKVEKDLAPDDFPLYQSVTEWALPRIRLISEQWNLGLDEAFFADYVSTFGNLYSRLPRQLVHRNLCPDNILFDNGDVSGFINFDLQEINLRLWDVCYAATGFMSETEEEDYEKWLDLLAGILHGYDKEAKLAPEEKAAVFYVILSIEFGCTAYFDGKEELELTARYNRKMLQFIARHRDRIERIF